MNSIDFMEDGVNVYRTKYFIVKQVLDVNVGGVLDNIIISHDTFYARTPARNAQYEKHFKDKININGKRLPSTASTRRYID